MGGGDRKKREFTYATYWFSSRFSDKQEKTI
jgi:hypothetical protein